MKIGMKFNFYKGVALFFATNAPIPECTCHMIFLTWENLNVTAGRSPDTATTTVLLITSTLVDAPLIRLTVEPSPENGLRATSQVMIDKAMTVRTNKLGGGFGQLDDTAMLEVNRALALFLGVAG